MFSLFSKKEKKAKPRFKGPKYIYRPFENTLSYRVEFREEGSFVYPGWGKSFLFKIEEDKIYRAGEEEPSYIIIGKGIYDAAGEKLIYKLASDAVYSPSARDPLFVIRESIQVQGTL